MGTWTEFWRRWSSPHTTAALLLAEYSRTQGLPEPDRLRALFKTRGGWKRIADPTLTALVDSLGSDSQSADDRLSDIMAFIIMGEACGLESILRSRGVQEAGLALSLAADRLPEAWQTHALRFGVCLAPEHPLVLARLAISYFTAGQCGLALPLFELAIGHAQLVKQSTQLLAHLRNPRPGTHEMVEGFDAWFAALVDLRDECRRHGESP